MTIQSMTNTRTDDVTATLEQIRRLAAAGCEIIRVAVPDQAAARAVGKIKEESPILWWWTSTLTTSWPWSYRRRGGQGAHQSGQYRKRG